MTQRTLFFVFAALLQVVFAFITPLAISEPASVWGTEYHVSSKGKDSNSGTAQAPFRTIQQGAEVALPGDVVTVHGGVYRERVNPPRGGESDEKRIIYQAAASEKVTIKGSEIITNWTKVKNDPQNETWTTMVPNALFGDFNPFATPIRGDWFNPLGRLHHVGAVYLNGNWLVEAANKDQVLLPLAEAETTFQKARRDIKDGLVFPGFWFAEVGDETTTLWAQFFGIDPNTQITEINVRQTVFYPDQPGRDFITVRGFVMKDAATPWAPPTAEQIGLIGTHWSKGWVIEDNVVSHSVCTGITLGKHGDKFDNTSADTAEGYVETIKRAHAFPIPWTKERIGGHLVRNNTISHCEQAGLVGSMGAVFCTITGNTIHDIHVRKLFTGAEMAGIKIHGAIDTTISRNTIFRTCLGLWLDWMTQGTRVSANLFHKNDRDLFVEVNHGPFVVDNNLFLSQTSSLLNVSRGGAFVHNLFVGSIDIIPFDARLTPFHKPHSTEVVGLHNNPCGDDRFINNIFVGRADLGRYDTATLPVTMEGNIFLNGAKPSKFEAGWAIDLAALTIEQRNDGFYFNPAAVVTPIMQARKIIRRFVTTELLGKARVSDLPFENPDGTSLRIDTDYFGLPRKGAEPLPGPFEYSSSDPATSVRIAPLGRPH